MQRLSRSLTIDQKEEIATALYKAVCYVTRSKGQRHCAYFAFAGIDLLKELCPEDEPFTPVWHRFEIKRVTNTLVENFGWLHSYEAWVYRREKYKFVDEVCTDHCFIARGAEILDFSTRTHGAYWRQKFQVVDWDFSPPFFWGTLYDVPTRYKDWFRFCGVLDPKKFLKGEYEESIIKEIVDEAMWRLDESGFSTGRTWTKPGPIFGGFSLHRVGLGVTTDADGFYRGST